MSKYTRRKTVGVGTCGVAGVSWRTLAKPTSANKDAVALLSALLTRSPQAKSSLTIDMAALRKEQQERSVRLQDAAARFRRYRIKYRTVEALKKLPKVTTDFANFIFPVIRNMPEQDLVEQLVAVQPMAQPDAQVMYMDFVHQPGDRAGAHNPPPWLNFGTLDDGLVRNAQEIVTRRYNRVDEDVNVLEHDTLEAQRTTAHRLALHTLYGATVRPPAAFGRLATDAALR